MLLFLYKLAFVVTSKLDIGFGVLRGATFVSFTFRLDVVIDVEFTRLHTSARCRKGCLQKRRIQARGTVILRIKLFWISTEIRVEIMAVNPALHVWFIGN